MVRLICSDGTDVLIDPNQVVAIHGGLKGAGPCNVHLVGGHFFSIEGTADGVRERLGLRGV